MLLTNVVVDGAPTRIRLAGSIIDGTGPDLERRAGERVVDCAGGTAEPGYTDHHLHLHALAAVRRSVRCGPPQIVDGGALATALATAAADDNGWVRGVGYAETVAGDLDSDALDLMCADRPIRICHRSGAMWMVNGIGARLLGLDTADHPGIERGPDGTATGRIFRADDWLRERLPTNRFPDLAAVGAELLSLGITSVTDATPDLDAAALAHLRSSVACGALAQRVQLLGVRLGHDVTEPRISTGPYKIVVADSGLPDLDDLTARIRAAHDVGRSVAVHCVTREALILTLVALADAGPTGHDRIEHAAIVPPDLIDELVRLRVTVVTQPGFLADRGHDYLREVDPADHDNLYRCASLIDAGVPVALSSDAPYGPLDPAEIIDAAVTRRVPGGRIAGPSERVTAADAAGRLRTPARGSPARLVRGAPADLVIRDSSGLTHAVIAGEMVR
ncbi:MULTISPECIES: amidohydrolase family protein [Gordonia]|jgi:predicted amidohydrolase YtcJ|uniref:Amidohydrolase family protein n=1 Tax=Gordonia pseudamarae TaxID=2831662 RepID=A0ABX6IF63_9ACTN|nr:MULTISPECIES: amidohydrolase family protein [Gordonia]MBD0022329.1 amidohydrolase family protein [Gordonia sp. (in: high G+C Gram-positive bacteria)]QHN33966.1 amidohydrolase family protein [Gordonia pseudamarae]